MDNAAIADQEMTGVVGALRQAVTSRPLAQVATGTPAFRHGGGLERGEVLPIGWPARAAAGQ
jgi:hypothetical protein